MGDILYKKFEPLMKWISFIVVIAFFTLAETSYLWSIYIAHQDSGIMAAIATMVLPVFGQMFWTVVLWDLQNIFVRTSIAIFVLYILSVICVLTYTELKERQNT